MNFGRRAKRSRFVHIDITSMMDVVFLLIIFFMVTARFARETRAELELPQETGEQNPESDKIGLVINIDRAGTIVINARESDLDGMIEFIAAEIARQPDRNPGGVKLTIRVDRNADTARLNEVITQLRKLGVGVARIATEVPR